MPRMMKIGDIFTDDEIAKARQIAAETQGHKLNARLVAEVVEPAMERIEQTTGQKNYAPYLAYMLEYAISQAS